jgi:glycosyltransferase involved in cell wall biosynthesis
MKLCIVTPNVIKGDGQGRANYEIVQESIRQGHHLTLVAHSVADELLQSPQIEWVHFKIPKVPTAFFKEVYFALCSASWLKTHQNEFDLVQSYGAVTFGKSDVNTAQFVHTSWLKSPLHTSKSSPNLYGLYHWIRTTLNGSWERQAFNDARAVVAVSEGIRNELKDIGVPDDRIHVILNGVDLEEFTPGSIDRPSLGLPVDKTLALFAGDIKTNRKNLDTVLRALATVSDMELVVVGSLKGSPYPDLAKQLGISDRVHFLGFRKDLPQIMRGVDLFVFPSRYEPFGMVVTEAMAAGLPVITAASTGAAQLVTPESGIVVQDAEDMNALALALTSLRDDRLLRQKMGAVGREIVQQHDWKSKAQQYLTLFESIAMETVS